MTIVISFCSVHFIGYNFSSASRLNFTLKSTNLCFLLEVGWSYHNTQFWTHSFFLLHHFFIYCFCHFCTVSAAAPVFGPGLTSNPALILYQLFILTLCNPLILCVSFLTTEKFFFSVNVLILPNSGCSIFLLLGRRSLSTPWISPAFSVSSVTWFNLLQRLQLFRWNFVPMMRRTTHRVLPHRGPVCRSGYQITKTQVWQCPSQLAQASPLGYNWCLQRFWSAFWSFERGAARAI